MLLRAGDDAHRSFRRQHIECPDKFFQLRKHCRSNLIGRLAIESQLHDTVIPTPSQRLSCKRFHAGFPLYMVAISAAKRRSIASRRNFPLAVSKPLSAVKALGRMEK